MKHPCHCEICEKARYHTDCPGCSGGHNSFWKTVVESPQWSEWEIEQYKRFIKIEDEDCLPVFDVDECRECGWISQNHFQELLKFITNKN